jgi:hypothetical protein
MPLKDTRRMRKTPQEKKHLSYEKDRKNCYGENDKSSRKAIRENKACSRRRIRRAVKKVKIVDGDLEDASEAEIKARQRCVFVKSPDCPLGEWLDGQEKRRAARFNRKKKDE